MLHNWPVLVAGMLGVVATVACYLVFQWQEQQRIASHAGFDAGVYTHMLRDGAQSYSRLNRDVAGLFSASTEVTPREFAAYIASIHARKTYPGLNHIGYLPRVPGNRIAQFEDRTRKTMPFYAVHSNRRDPGAVFPLLYAAPFDETARRFLGFDYAMISERREAMQQAGDLGESVATHKLAYLSSPATADYIFLFTPVYDAARPADSPEQRRIALSGYVFSVFLLDDAIEGIMGAGFKQQFDLEIYDGARERQRLLYDGDGHPHLLDGSAPAAYTETIDFAGRRWILHFRPKAPYLDRYALRHSWLILLSGALASLVFAWLTWKWLERRRAQRQEADRAQRFNAVFEHHPSAVLSLDTQSRITNANSHAIQLLATTRNKLLGAPMLEAIASEDVERAGALLHDALPGVPDRCDCTLITDEGKRIEVSIVLVPVTTAGKLSGILAIADNITERRQSEWRLQESRQMLQQVIDNIPQRVFWKDTELYFLGCNKAFCEDAGLGDPQQIVGKTDSDFDWKEEAEAYRQDDLRTMQSGIAKVNYEEAQHRQDGKTGWLRTSKIPLADAQGRTVGVLGVYEDITERKQMEQGLARISMYDSLTGLPNRAHFLAHLEQTVDKAKWHGTLLTLMVVDIDKFKQINDTHGHGVGDEVLVICATRMKEAIRESDVAGRLGGDEFCLLIELPNRQAAHKLADKLIDAMRPAMQAGEITLQIGASIGIAFHAPGITADTLIRHAGQAMCLAKQAGGNQFKTAPDSAQPE